MSAQASAKEPQPDPRVDQLEQGQEDIRGRLELIAKGNQEFAARATYVLKQHDSAIKAIQGALKR